MKESYFIKKNFAQPDRMTLPSHDKANFFRMIFMENSFTMSLTKKGISHVSKWKVFTSNTEFNSEVIT